METRRYVICSVFIVILLMSTLLAVSRGMASVYAYTAGSVLSNLRNQTVQPGQIDWPVVRQNLEKALAYDADNPQYANQLGSAYEAEYLYSEVGDTQAEAHRQRAFEYYLKALKRRPAWPYDWVYLALVSYRLGKTDDDFKHALFRAYELGPWEDHALYIIADIGMHHWFEFSETEQAFVLDVIRQGLNSRTGGMAMIRLAWRYDMLDRICPSLVTANTEVVKFCREL